MDEFCPLCRKKGRDNKVKPVQINFHEAVYLCESETCHWPYGYEEFKIIPRSIDEIGKIPTKKTNRKPDFHKTKNFNYVTPISTELSMYTPPVTPSSDNFSSKETVNGTTTNSILYEIFNPNTDTDCNDDVSNLGKSMKPLSDNSYGSTNDSPSKTQATCSAAVLKKNENVPPQVPSIFDIDSSAKLSSKKHSLQYNVLKNCVIKNDDENYNKSTKLNSEYSRRNSKQVKTFPQIQNITITDINLMELKTKRKTKSSVHKIKCERMLEESFDRLETSLNKKIVIFKEKSLNGVTFEDTNLINITNITRIPTDDDNNWQTVTEYLPKKMSKISGNQEFYNQNALGKMSLVKNLTPTLSDSDISVNVVTPDQSLIVNKFENNDMSISTVVKEKSESTGNNFDNMMDNSFSSDNINFDSIIEEDFLTNCSNDSQDIDDDWLQSFLI